MVHLKKGIFPIGTYSKLKMKKFENGNSYEVELPYDMDISLIFHVFDLYKYHELDDEVVVLDDYPKKKIEEIADIGSESW